MNDTNGYQTAHRTLALYDASTLFGRLWAKGADAIDLLHRMSTNDLLPLISNRGTGAQTVLTTEKGRIVDLLCVMSLGTDALLITSKSKENTVVEWLDKFVIMEDAKFEIATGSMSQFLIFGPDALSFLQNFTETGLIGLANYHFIDIEIHGISCQLQKTHRIIESGFAVFVDSSNAASVFEFLRNEISGMGGVEIDDETYETLRIESGIPIAPNELNEKHNPLETTLVQAISWTKGCYIGQEVIARLDTYDKVQRHLMGVEFQNSNPMNAPAPLASTDGTEIGEITSITFSPKLGKPIGLAFVKTAFANPNTTAADGVRLVKLPFQIEE